MDAEPAPLTTARLVPPEHPAVWIRLAGAWHPGEIEAWYRAEHGRGAWCVLVRSAVERAAYRYDPETIRRREPGETGPGGA